MGKKIKELRIKQKISMSKLSELSKVNRSTIKRIESGHDCAFGTVEKLVECLGFELVICLK